MTKKRKKSLRSQKTKFVFPELLKISLNLSAEVRRIIFGVFFVFLGSLFLLSFLNISGPLGDFFTVIFDEFFGVGKWLIPLACLGFAVFLFNKNEEDEFYFGTGFGIVLILISLLAIGDLVEPDLTGASGRFLSSLESVIGFFSSVMAFSALLVVGFVIDFWEILKSFLNNRKERFAMVMSV